MLLVLQGKCIEIASSTTAAYLIYSMWLEHYTYVLQDLSVMLNIYIFDFLFAYQ